MDKKGLYTPKDISILSFDDTIISTALNITSIRHPVDLMMKNAIDYLLNENKLPIQKSLSPILIERDSTSLYTKLSKKKIHNTFKF